MYVLEYDPIRVILFCLHTDGPLTEAEVDSIVAATQRAADDALRQGAAVTVLVIIESRYSPTAEQRKRLGEATALCPHPGRDRGHRLVQAGQPRQRAFHPCNLRGRAKLARQAFGPTGARARRARAPSALASAEEA
jgi:hypothetical protein